MMKSTMLAALAGGLLATAVATTPAAGSTVYAENFDSGGATGFTFNGLWHVTSNFYASERQALGYVQNETAGSQIPDGDYDVPFGDPAPAAFSPLISLSANGVNTLTLNAVNFNEIGDDPDGYDWLEIGVSLDKVHFDRVLTSTTHSDLASDYFAPSAVGAPYQALSLGLGAYAGQDIYLMFRYVTLDGVNNLHPGARIDDILITNQPGVAVDGGVPEPATWALLMLGFGAVGCALRSRKPAGAAQPG